MRAMSFLDPGSLTDKMNSFGASRLIVLRSHLEVDETDA